MRLRNLISWTALLGTSFGLHAVGFAKLGRVVPAPAAAPPKPAFVDMTVKPRPVPAPAPAPAPQDKPAPRAVRRVAALAPRPAEGSPPPAARATPPAAVPETPADFSGTTLTNDGPGQGWASATGSGAALKGPIGRPGARVTGRQVEGRGPAASGPSDVVAVADLSRRPEAPRLDEALERNYPAEARRSGQAGKAVIRARITPEGAVRDLAIVSESAPGFGRACQATLAGSRWTPPLDREGRPVATLVNYTCRFEIR